jgi:GNAT superfamily N-acetyltransferase
MRPFEPRIAREAEKAHFTLQKGVYFSKMRKFGKEAVILYSETIKDFFWNYATRIRTTNNKIEKLIDKVASFLKSIDRQVTFYLTSFTLPKNLDEILKKKGFEIQFVDSWMFHEKKKLPKTELPNDFSLGIVETTEQMKTFVDVFNIAYGGAHTENAPYGGLPSYYGETLLRSFSEKRKGVKRIHYLGYIKKDPVGVGSIFITERFACIYNVGVPAVNRKRGIGSAISIKAVEDARALGVNHVFLQTENGSYVERFYQSLGFKTKFVGKGYALSI